MKEVSTTRLIMLHFACMVIGKEIAREGMKNEKYRCFSACSQIEIMMKC